MGREYLRALFYCFGKRVVVSLLSLLLLWEESKPDSVLAVIYLNLTNCQTARLFGEVLPNFGVFKTMLVTPSGNCSRGDCPFHSHSSLLLSTPVNSGAVFKPICEKGFEKPAITRSRIESGSLALWLSGLSCPAKAEPTALLPKAYTLYNRCK